MKINRAKYNLFLGKFLAYFLILYTFFMLGRSVWVNWQLQKQTRVLEAEIAKTKQKNKDLSNLILYYKSDSFREVEARKKLGLKKPDEKVALVPVKKYEDFNQELSQQQAQVAEKPSEVKETNPMLWWQYFIK